MFSHNEHWVGVLQEPVLEMELFASTMTMVNVYSRCVSCVGGLKSLLHVSVFEGRKTR